MPTPLITSRYDPTTGGYTSSSPAFAPQFGGGGGSAGYGTYPSYPPSAFMVGGKRVAMVHPPLVKSEIIPGSRTLPSVGGRAAPTDDQSASRRAAKEFSQNWTRDLLASTPPPGAVAGGGMQLRPTGSISPGLTGRSYIELANMLNSGEYTKEGFTYDQVYAAMQASKNP